ncbi:hypothetical protein MKW92_050551, partial [Papaver armeniacum]
MAAINGEGVVSLGVSIKNFVDAIKRVNTLNSTLFLGTNEGKILTHNNYLNASVVINDASVSVELTKDMDNIGNDHRRESAIIHVILHIYGQHLDIAGIKAESTIVFRENGLLTQVRRSDSVSSLLLALAIISVFLSTTFFIVVISRGTRRGMFLSATLMKQMEATQQAERRSMNKSIVFASANHDIRGTLTTIVGLIEFCLTGVSPDSNLDLQWIFLVILDASRIEAGKMQLHEEVFDSAKVIEEAVNFIYPGGLEKVIDVVLDHCDSSVLKSPLVKGNRGKLKQVLNNLLSNTVKFTSEVHVVLRAWARKPNPNTSSLSPIYNGIGNIITRHSIRLNVLENSLELVVEVNHTLENGYQKRKVILFLRTLFKLIKETTLGQGGTGLGLGIVQSLVRLMRGEISILDKEISEKETCLSFNKIEGLSSSHVILVIQDDEIKSVKKNFMRTPGVKVSAINQWEHVRPTLQQIKRCFYVNSQSSSGKFEQLGLYTDYLKMYDGSLSGNEQVEASRSSTPLVTNFRINLPGDIRFQIVGLLSPIITEKNMRIARKRLMATCNDFFIKPFHGSRLDQVLKLLPKFGDNIREGIISNAIDEHVTKLSSSTKKNFYPCADRIVQQG